MPDQQQQQTCVKLLLFGDQTDPWLDGLDRLHKHAPSTPWLRAYLDDVASAISDEIKKALPTLRRRLRDSIDHLGHFASIQELADRYRHTLDDVGPARTLLIHVLRTASLLECVHRWPDLLRQDSRVEWVGISGGLLSLAPLAVSLDFNDLYAVCLESARMVVRLCKFTIERSRAVEDGSGYWGYAVLGIAPEPLRIALDQFQRTVGVPAVKHAKLAVVGPGWNTVVGPPSVLKLVVEECPELRHLPKNPLEIHALQHTLPTAEPDLDYMVGDNALFLDKPICRPANNVWGLDDPQPSSYPTYRHLLRAVCAQVLSKQLDIPSLVQRVTTALRDDQGAAATAITHVSLLQMGESSHHAHLSASLVEASPSRSVAVAIEPPPSPADRFGDIAIVGMAGRGPESENLDEFWQTIVAQRDTCTEVPKDRFDIDEYYCTEHGNSGAQCTMTTRYGCCMSKPGNFDARFFQISPREAMLMDVGHRQFLMATYEALEMAGYSDGHTKAVDPRRIAVFKGQCSDDWHDAAHATLGCDAYTLQGIQRAFGPARLAFTFKWEGPTYSLDSACASSAASIHLACQALQQNEIDMAVAGASNILSYPHSFTCLSKSGVLSDTGNCKTFRDDADGYCRADFVGSIVLKRLQDAVAHNDNVLAVISASGRNHGGNSSSITAPDPGAQERLFRSILRSGRTTVDQVQYVEMHGTGTQIGDPAEMKSITNLFCHRTTGSVPVGSVKANFGHSEAAAGMASLFKCIKMFQENVIPPQVGMPHPLNPNLPPLSDNNVDIPSKPRPFPQQGLDHPRRILLNNFDASGGNACILLEDFDVDPSSAIRDVDPRKTHIVAFSARTRLSLNANKRNLAEWLRKNSNAAIQDVAYTTTARRMHHTYRSAYAATSTHDLLSKLQADTGTPDDVLSPLAVQQCNVVFVFTGQGSSYAGMGSQLYNTSPVFRDQVDLCASICKQHGFPDFLPLICEKNAELAASSTTITTQLAVLALEIGLAAFWESVGVEPFLVLGHSLGEYAALHVAGVLPLTDVIYLVGKRALLMLERTEADAYAMLSVQLSASEIHHILDVNGSKYPCCTIACINSPTSTVISGPTQEISELQKDITNARSRLLDVPYGFHSRQTDPILSEYVSLAETVTYLPPRVPMASTVLARVISTPGTIGGWYMGQQTRQEVNFVGAVEAALEHHSSSSSGAITWLELGPNRVCSPLIQAIINSSTSPMNILSTLDTAHQDDWGSVSRCLAAVYNNGIDVDWLNFHLPYANHLKLLVLPSYSWDLKEYWVSYSDAAKQIRGATTEGSSRQQVISTCAQYIVTDTITPNDLQVKLTASLRDTALRDIICGHRMLDIPIAAGSVFCEAGLAAAIHLLKSLGRSEDATVTKLCLRNPAMTRPLTLSLVGDGELLTSVEMDSQSGGQIRVSWKAASTADDTSYEIGSCNISITENLDRVQSDWNRMSYFVKSRMDDVVGAAKDGRGHRLAPEIFYSLFGRTVQYDERFKCVKEAFIAKDWTEAVAEIVLSEPVVGARFLLSPYWGESIAQLAGFTVNANPANDVASSWINKGFQSFEHTQEFQPGRSYFTYVKVSSQVAEIKTVDIFVFTAESMLVAECLECEFHQVTNTTLKRLLGGREPRPVSTRTSEHIASDESPSNTSQSAYRPPATAVPQRPSVIELTPGTTSNQGILHAMLESISSATGINESELTDNTTMAELGVDSIMSIEISAKVSQATEKDISPSFLAENPTIGDLRRTYADSDPPATITALDSSLASPMKTPPEATSGWQDNPIMITPPTPPSEAEELIVPAATTAVEYFDESEPHPQVRVTLLQGKPSRTQAPLYMIADGTGNIASYIHIPPFKSKQAMYGVDSPFVRCPSRLTIEVGIEGVVRLIVKALIKKQPPGVPFSIGGFSGGAMMAYETCRQLAALGHVVDKLLLIDMCSPRPQGVSDNSDIGLAFYEAIAGTDESGVWSSSNNTYKHLSRVFACVANYHPPELGSGELPPARRTALIWARKGMIGRAGHSEKLQRLLTEQSISTTTPPPGFMEDPRYGAVAWSLPHKREADLRFNGWDRWLGTDTLWSTSIDSDHLQMPTPQYAPLLGQEMERCFTYLDEGA